MSSPKRPLLPFILSANDLIAGSAVYHGACGWSHSLSDALVAKNDVEADMLEAAKRDAEREQRVVELELVPVCLDDAGLVAPRHYRERIRALGPTVRLDLGPQAMGLHAHVSV